MSSTVHVATSDSTLACPGMLQMWCTGTPPAGWLLCNGALVSRTTYAALFAVIGTTFGIGDGSTTFALPDGRDRTIVGAGSSYTIGQTGGSSSYTPAGSNAAISGTATAAVTNVSLLGILGSTKA